MEMLLKHLVSLVLYAVTAVVAALIVYFLLRMLDKKNDSPVTYEHQIFILEKHYNTGIDFASWNKLRALFDSGWEIEALLAEGSQSVNIILRRQTTLFSH